MTISLDDHSADAWEAADGNAEPAADILVSTLLELQASGTPPQQGWAVLSNERNRLPWHDSDRPLERGAIAKLVFAMGAFTAVGQAFNNIRAIIARLLCAAACWGVLI
jgi:hypothetical protein